MSDMYQGILLVDGLLLLWKCSAAESLLLFHTVPGAIPLESIQGSAYEEKIILKWREPAQTYGIITQFEVQKRRGWQNIRSIDCPLEW